MLATILFTALLPMTVLAQASAAAEIPFQFRDGFIWVKVSAAHGEKPLNFLLDTGAGVSVIDQSVAERLGHKLGERVRVAGVQTSVIGFWPQRIAMKIGKIPLPRDLLAVDLSKLGSACATPVDGLVGADFFRGRVVQIDFRERVIRLLTPEQGRKVQGEPVALNIRSCGLRVPMSVNGRKLQWLRLDTGCAAPLHWVTASVEPALCRRQLAVGLTKLSLPAATVTAEVGSSRFVDVAAVIHEREIFAGEAGLLGNGLLTRFAQVTIDTKSKRLVLSRDPNPAGFIPIH